MCANLLKTQSLSLGDSRLSTIRIRDKLNDTQAVVEALRDSLLPLLRREEISEQGLDGIYYLFGHVSQSIGEVEQMLGDSKITPQALQTSRDAKK